MIITKYNYLETLENILYDIRIDRNINPILILDEYFNKKSQEEKEIMLRNAAFGC